MKGLVYAMKQLVIIGASAMGRETFYYARAIGLEVKGFLDNRTNILDGFVGYPPIISSMGQYISPKEAFVCAIGNPKQKLEYAALVEARGGDFISITHPKAYISGNVKIGSGCIIAPYSIVSCDTELGRHVIVNDAATIGHDCRIGDGCTISPGAHLAGRVQLERGIFVGIGANIIPDIKIGENSIIGAGATIVKDVPPNVVVAGVPARIIKRIHNSPRTYHTPPPSSP